MGWIRAHYDRVALIAAAAFLLLCSILIWRKSAQFQTEFAVSQTAPPPKKFSTPAKAVELETARQKLNHPPRWTFSSRSGLFVPEKHFVGTNGLLATLETTEVHPPVPNDWLEQFSLPIAEGDVLDQDPDGDGFTNLDEWHDHSDPTDENSHPDYVTKLKLKSATEEPFRLMFSSWVGDSYAINTIDLKQPTQFVKKGDTIRGTRFKIVKFTEKYQPDKYGTDVDLSEVTLEHDETKQRLTLTKEKVATSPESVATFIYSWSERRELQVRKDQEFSLNPEEQIKYKLIDVQPAKAVIVNTQKPDEPIEIGSIIP
ncbi:MAG TPA: Amuc_1099 family pilus-like system protein [Chthoniobacterales bacterium]|nr:Amuc_1099 family pilus-like system protein [Chthoniobacterales bacterium]